MEYRCNTFTFFYFRFDSENYYVNVVIVRTGRCVFVPGREIRNRWMLQYDKATKKRTAKKNKKQNTNTLLGLYNRPVLFWMCIQPVFNLVYFCVLLFWKTLRDELLEGVIVDVSQLLE